MRRMETRRETFRSFPSLINIRRSRLQPIHTRYAMLVALATTMLSVAAPVRASIVYTPVNLTVSGNGIIKIDLNRDGRVDTSIVASGRSVICAGTGPGSAGAVYALPASGDGAQANGSYIVALGSGAAINSTKTFYSPEGLMLQYSSCLWPPHVNLGAWQNVTNHYMGIKFQVSGHTHYGWARLSVTMGRVGPVVRLTGYAYETIAGHGITAGQTSGT